MVSAKSSSSEAIYNPSVKSTALGAVGLALSGHRAAAEAAAKWVSRYQVTAEYAGTGNPETGEHTPPEDVIGAFLSDEAALRKALVSGVGSSNAHGKSPKRAHRRRMRCWRSRRSGPTPNRRVRRQAVGAKFRLRAQPQADVPHRLASGPGHVARNTTRCSTARMQALHLDGLGGPACGLWRQWADPRSGLGSALTIASRLLGVAGAGEVVRATGGAGSSSRW